MLHEKNNANSKFSLDDTLAGGSYENWKSKFV